MQEIIDRILGGNFDYENGSLEFSCSKIEISLSQGTAYEGSFHILSASDGYVKGSVISDHLRMECMTDQFTGVDAEIFYCFHGENLEEGDVVKGAFSVVSNRGEYNLPFVVTVEHGVLNSSIGPIRNLFHFANLAKGNWKEAVRLFYDPEFLRLFQGNDAHFYDSYRILSAYEGNEQNVEEFLICINKKQQLEFLTEEKELIKKLPRSGDNYGVTENTLTIVRNGWGYTRLQVECEGEFVFTEKEIISDDDFLGNRCRLPVYIDSSLCRPGRNFGRIYIYNAYTSLEIPVTVQLGDGAVMHHADHSRMQCVSRMMKYYEEFRLKKIGTGTWLSETGKLVERMVTMDEKDVSARLFQAQLLITEERYNEAGWILDHAADMLEAQNATGGELWAYYLYLTTLIHRDPQYTLQMAEQVEQIYRYDRSCWRVAWLLLYLSEEYNRSTSGKWMFLEKQYQYGCSSPVIYLEALTLLNGNPALLRKLNGFELQVLNFGVRQNAVNDSLVEQLLYLSGRVREYSPLLGRILRNLYEKKNDVRILQEVCSLLIKGSKTGADAFLWYQRGVESHLRITNLYEYYMASIDMDAIQELPKVILMYFSFQSNLDYEHSAFLYAYLLKHRKEYEELYQHYEPRMERFVIDQIQKLHINRHLAALYQEFLSPAIVTEVMAKPLSQLLFAHLVRVEDARMRKVIVGQPGNLVQAETALQNGVAWVAVYGNEYTIAFEDAYGNRFLKNVEYTLEKLLVPGKYLRLLEHYVPDTAELDLYFMENGRSEERISSAKIMRMARLATNPCVELKLRNAISVQLVQAYFDADNMQALDEYLQEISGEELSGEQRETILRFLVLRGSYEKAYEWIERYTPYFADAKILLRLTDGVISQAAHEGETVLYAAALTSFRKGKYNGQILEYLVRYAVGTTKELRDIWKTARSFEVDCYILSEKILLQMLFSGAFVGERLDIFRYYISQGARQEIEEAVLVQSSYDYFCREKITEEYIFREIRNCYLRGEETQRICKLAYLKFYAENKDRMEREDEPLIQEFLQEMMKEHIHLNFFREYKDCLPQLQEMKDKTIVEYHTRGGVRARIHYVMLHENGQAEDYLSEYMQEVYSGVFFKEFVLFFGENLQYYIMEESENEEQLTESGSLQRSDIMNESPDSKYEMINDMMISMTLRDDTTLDHLIEEYYRREYLDHRLFTLQ